MYSFLLRPEDPMSKSTCAPALRQHYRPEVNRVPDWLRRVWLWF
jgi:hypothetical protein